MTTTIEFPFGPVTQHQGCANYARKGMTCCYSHRKLEISPVSEVVIKPLMKKKGYPAASNCYSVKYIVPKKTFAQVVDENEWPTVEQAKNTMFAHDFENRHQFEAYARNMLVIADGKFEKKLFVLVCAEAVIYLDLCNSTSYKRFMTAIINKLEEFECPHSEYIEMLKNL